MYQNSSIRPISLLSQDVLLSAPLNSTAPLNTLHRAIEANAFAISESIALTRESHYFSASNPPSLTSPPRSIVHHPPFSTATHFSRHRLPLSRLRYFRVSAVYYLQVYTGAVFLLSVSFAPFPQNPREKIFPSNCPPARI